MRVAVLIFLFVVFGFGSELVGVVERFYGEVFIVRHYKRVKIFRGLNVYRDDEIVTKEFSNIDIRFKNGKLLSLGENSRIKIANFLRENRMYEVKRLKEIKIETKKSEVKEFNEPLKMGAKKHIFIIKSGKQNLKNISEGLGSVAKTKSAKVKIDE